MKLNGKESSGVLLYKFFYIQMLQAKKKKVTLLDSLLEGPGALPFDRMASVYLTSSDNQTDHCMS